MRTGTHTHSRCNAYAYAPIGMHSVHTVLIGLCTDLCGAQDAKLDERYGTQCRNIGCEWLKGRPADEGASLLLGRELEAGCCCSLDRQCASRSCSMRSFTCERQPGDPNDGGENNCCEAMTAACKACSEGMTEDEWCRAHPAELDCPSDDDHEIDCSFVDMSLGCNKCCEDPSLAECAQCSSYLHCCGGEPPAPPVDCSFVDMSLGCDRCCEDPSLAECAECSSYLHCCGDGGNGDEDGAFETRCRTNDCKVEEETSRGPLGKGCCCSTAEQCTSAVCDASSMTCE